MTLYRRGREFEELYQLAELLVDWDERVILFRRHHLKALERIIGGHVVGTQGTPVEVLAERVDHQFFPELWKVRNELTAIADEREGLWASSRGGRLGGLGATLGFHHGLLCAAGSSCC